MNEDVLSAFKVKDLPSSLTIMLKLEHDMKELKKCQYPDGGFSFWKPTNKSWDYPNPFISAHVTNCIAKCIEKGIYHSQHSSFFSFMEIVFYIYRFSYFLEYFMTHNIKY